MPHIHTEPGQHDITTSAWIFREDGDELRALVHMHRKHGKLMQVGGHIELDETPWQTLAHEIPEEAGFAMSQLHVLQPLAKAPDIPGVAIHPVPVLANTHMVNDTHYHSDFGYAFIASGDPERAPADGESLDLRWLTIQELHKAALAGIALDDVVGFYEYLAQQVVPTHHRIDATKFTVEKPAASLLQTK